MRLSEKLLLPIAFGLIACGSELSKIDNESSLPKAKEIGTTVKQVEIQPEFKRNNFTTEGKLTKAVETPWGAKQVYDPAQDTEIIAAHRHVKALKIESRQQLSKRDDNGVRRYVDPNIDLLYHARKIHNQDIMRIGCTRLKTYECGVTYMANLKLNSLLNNTCNPLDNLGKPAQPCEGELDGVGAMPFEACTVNGKLQLRIPEQLVERLSGRIEEPATPSDFFAFNCNSWSRYMTSEQLNPESPVNE